MKTRKNRVFFKDKALLSIILLVPFSLLGGCAQDFSKGQLEKQAVQPSLAESTTEQKIPLALPQNSSKRLNLGGPLTLFHTENFVGSGTCSMCHDKLTDADGRDMSITNHWRSTMMANASKDPLWQAKVVSETSRNPAIKAIIEEKCVTCHMPMAWSQLQADPQKYHSANIFDTWLDSESPLHEAALDGVSCSFCHQVQDKELGSPKSFSGKFTIDTKTPAPDRPIFGPYKITVPDPMQTSIGYTPIYGSHTNDSALCATCHTLFTPYLDSKGEIAGEFPEQTPYLEWLHSEYGETSANRHEIGETVGTVRTCQECHMPHSKAGGVYIAKPIPKTAKKQDHFSQHHFVGTNIMMLNILQDNITPLHVTASTDKLEQTKERTADLLQNKSVTLSLIDTKVNRNTLNTTVEVQSLVGHKFPTGFPSRRTWLHVAVTAKNGEIVFESGRPLANGAIKGDDGDEKTTYEPHYDLISSVDQVQIYESVMHDTEGQVTQTLLRGAGYIKDNRLLPRGFDKKTASEEIGVKGGAVEDDNFTGGMDRVSYAIPLGNHTGMLTVTVKLLFTPISYTFMADLKKDAAQPAVGRFANYYDRADKTPVTVAAVQKQLSL